MIKFHSNAATKAITPNDAKYGGPESRLSVQNGNRQHGGSQRPPRSMIYPELKGVPLERSNSREQFMGWANQHSWFGCNTGC